MPNIPGRARDFYVLQELEKLLGLRETSRKIPIHGAAKDYGLTRKIANMLKGHFVFFKEPGDPTSLVTDGYDQTYRHDYTSIKITWSNPDDLVLKDQNDVERFRIKWLGTRVLKKPGSTPPSSPTDGTVILVQTREEDAEGLPTNKDAYNVAEGGQFLTDQVPEETKYSYAAFPYTQYFVYTTEGNMELSGVERFRYTYDHGPESFEANGGDLTWTVAEYEGWRYSVEITVNRDLGLDHTFDLTTDTPLDFIEFLYGVNAPTDVPRWDVEGVLIVENDDHVPGYVTDGREFYREDDWWDSEPLSEEGYDAQKNYRIWLRDKDGKYNSHEHTLSIDNT